MKPRDQHGPTARLGARPGTRVVGKVPHGRWKTLTFLAALRSDRVEAPVLLDGPINGERFRLYVGEVLVPTLKPGDVVILDNLGSHKGKAVRRLIREAGARLLFLPKYSPDLNPIEQLFAKLKHRCATPPIAPPRPAEPHRRHPRHRPSAECSSDLINAGYERK